MDLHKNIIAAALGIIGLIAAGTLLRGSYREVMNEVLNPSEKHAVLPESAVDFNTEFTISEPIFPEGYFGGEQRLCRARKLPLRSLSANIRARLAWPLSAPKPTGFPLRVFRALRGESAFLLRMPPPARIASIPQPTRSSLWITGQRRT